MKLSKTLLGIILSTCFYILPFSDLEAKKLKLSEALSQNLIQANIVPSSENGVFSVEFNIRSNTNENLELELETGRKLICENSSYQNLMITENKKLNLFGKIWKKIKIRGMCINAHKGSPSGKSFSMGKMADKDLIAAAKIIEQEKLQNSEGQHAVWIVSDNEAHYANSLKNKRIKQFINQFLTKRPAEYVGKINFKLSKSTMVYYDIMTLDNKKIFTADSVFLTSGSYHQSVKYKIDNKYKNYLSSGLKVLIRPKGFEEDIYQAELKNSYGVSVH